MKNPVLKTSKDALHKIHSRFIFPCLSNSEFHNTHSLTVAASIASGGAIAGTALNHAVVLTEGKAGRQIEAAGNKNKKAYTLSKHGKDTTNEQQLLRANTAKAPDGTQDRWLNDSSRWLRNVDTSDGIAVAKRRWEEMRQLGIKDKNEIPIQFDKNIGEGYLKGTDILVKTKEAIFRFNPKGELITSYPKIRN